MSLQNHASNRIGYLLSINTGRLQKNLTTKEEGYKSEQSQLEKFNFNTNVLCEQVLKTYVTQNLHTPLYSYSAMRNLYGFF